jgi:hypothetical protein
MRENAANFGKRPYHRINLKGNAGINKTIAGGIRTKKFPYSFQPCCDGVV